MTIMRVVKLSGKDLDGGFPPYCIEKHFGHRYVESWAKTRWKVVDEVSDYFILAEINVWMNNPTEPSAPLMAQLFHKSLFTEVPWPEVK